MYNLVLRAFHAEGPGDEIVGCWTKDFGIIKGTGILNWSGHGLQILKVDAGYRAGCYGQADEDFVRLKFCNLTSELSHQTG